MDVAEFERVLARQLAMNGETYARLRQRGLMDDSKVRLDFAYLAPTKTAAKKLEQLLTTQTDYDVALNERDDSTLLVVGTTQETAISLDVLNEWVTWMVTAGQEADGCVFDGWGTSV